MNSLEESKRKKKKKAKRPFKLAYSAMFRQNLKPDREWGKMSSAILESRSNFQFTVGGNRVLKKCDKPKHSSQCVKGKGCLSFFKREKPIKQSETIGGRD